MVLLAIAVGPQQCFVEADSSMALQDALIVPIPAGPELLTCCERAAIEVTAGGPRKQCFAAWCYGCSAVAEFPWLCPLCLTKVIAGKQQQQHT